MTTGRERTQLPMSGYLLAQADASGPVDAAGTLEPALERSEPAGRPFIGAGTSSAPYRAALIRGSIGGAFRRTYPPPAAGFATPLEVRREEADRQNIAIVVEVGDRIDDLFLAIVDLSALSDGFRAVQPSSRGLQ